MAIASLILGILGVLSSFFTVGFGGMGLGLVALILGILGRKGAQGRDEPTGMATAGMVLGIVGLAFGVIFFVTCSLCVSAMKQNVEEAMKLEKMKENETESEALLQHAKERKATLAAAETGKIEASCDATNTISTCTDYTAGSMLLGRDTMKSLCEAANEITGQKDAKLRARFVDGAPCPSDGVVGTCTLPGKLIRYYGRGPLAYKAAAAQADCTGLYNGTWAAAK
jgi:hypothetical protein